VASDPAQINTLLVIERLKMIARVVQKNPAQLSDLLGFINRAAEFLL